MTVCAEPRGILAATNNTPAALHRAIRGDRCDHLGVRSQPLPQRLLSREALHVRTPISATAARVLLDDGVGRYLRVTWKSRCRRVYRALMSVGSLAGGGTRGDTKAGRSPRTARSLEVALAEPQAWRSRGSFTPIRRGFSMVPDPGFAVAGRARSSAQVVWSERGQRVGVECRPGPSVRKASTARPVIGFLAIRTGVVERTRSLTWRGSRSPT